MLLDEAFVVPGGGAARANETPAQGSFGPFNGRGVDR